MLISKSTKYRNTLKVSHADSFGLKVLGKLSIRKFTGEFLVQIFQCKTLCYVDELIFKTKFESDNIEEIYREIKYKYSKKLKPNEFFTVTKI